MRTYLLLSIVALAFSGCGGESSPPVAVSGKVSMKGKPIEGAVVTFHASAQGRSASGKTAADGTFKLTTNKTDDGAKPGEYTVTISKQEAKTGGSSGVDITKGDFGAAYGQMMGAAGSNNMAKAVKDALPAKYASAASSGLSRTVVKGEKNEFEFDLE
jgi:Carboxypeptidase regulatory-like domain